MCAIGILETEGLFYLEPVVILDPIMNTSRDMESVNDVEVVSPKNNPAPVRAKRTYAEITKNQQSGDHSDSFVKLMKNTVLHLLFSR